jgi:hypothetical protein
MKHFYRVPMVLFLACALTVHAQAQFALISITSPTAGQVVQGAVTVTGTNAMPDFAYAEVAFSYALDTTGTWFPITQVNQPIEAGTLAIWDTTLITDGDYTLRLRVTLTDGTTHDITVPNLRVRNYTPVETSPPVSTAGEETMTPLRLPTATLYPTPTALPANLAEVTQEDVWSSIAFGGLAAVFLIGMFGIYLRLRRK